MILPLPMLSEYRLGKDSQVDGKIGRTTFAFERLCVERQ
jgi:hypothetical protein